MKMKIDKAGRIVLPKAVRGRYGLSVGTVLEIEETDDAIILRPVTPKPTVREKDGLLVVAAEAEGDLTDAVRQMRDQRLDDLAETATTGRKR